MVQISIPIESHNMIAWREYYTVDHIQIAVQEATIQLLEY